MSFGMETIAEIRDIAGLEIEIGIHEKIIDLRYFLSVIRYLVSEDVESEKIILPILSMTFFFFIFVL